MEVIVIDSDSESDSNSSGWSSRTPVPAIQPTVEERSHFFETPEYDRPLQSVEVIQPWMVPGADDGQKAADSDDDVQITEVRNITRRMSLTEVDKRFSSTLSEPPAPLLSVQPAQAVQSIQLVPSIQQSLQDPVQSPLQPTIQPPASQSVDQKKKSNPIFTFQKGRNSNGDVFFTVSQVVAGASMCFRDLPDLPGADARNALKTARHKFVQKSVLGALVYIDQAGGQHILKTATSSNIGPGGRIFGGEAPSAKVLWKPIWRKRVIRLAPMLKHRLGSIYDGAGSKGSGMTQEKYGSYHSAHVEKKLATFLLYMLLEDFGILAKDSFATCKDIRRLRDLIRADPRRMKFEILVSRKWCGSCICFLRKLRSASGIDMILRVQPVVEALPTPKGKMVSIYEDCENDEEAASVAKTLKNGAAQGDEINEETFDDEELAGRDAMDIDGGDEAGEYDEEEKSPEPAIQHNQDPDQPHSENQEDGTRSTVAPSEPRALEPQDEEGNELFFPLHPSPRLSPPPIVKEEDIDSRDIHMMGVTLTQEEESALFGTPEPPVVQLSSPIQEPDSPGVQPDLPPGHASISPLRITKSRSPNPLPGIDDEGDELFLPLYDQDHRRQETASPAASSQPESPEEDFSWEVIVIEDTPPPPSAETIANFAKIAAEHAYKAPPTVPRRPGPPMSIEVARERVFQKKPLPATPVTEEPFSPIETSFARERAATAVPRRTQLWTSGDDPVFQQLEMEL